MPLTIYFAGAISGGRGDVAHYRAIVAALERDGHRVLAGAVAAEHVGADGETLQTAAIFERDMQWIAHADVLVAEVSMPVPPNAGARSPLATFPAFRFVSRLPSP